MCRSVTQAEQVCHRIQEIIQSSRVLKKGNEYAKASNKKISQYVSASKKVSRLGSRKKNENPRE